MERSATDVILGIQEKGAVWEGEKLIEKSRGISLDYKVKKCVLRKRFDDRHFF